MNQKNVADEFDLNLSANDLTSLGPCRSMHVGGSRILKVNIAIAATFTILLASPAVVLFLQSLPNPGKNYAQAAAFFGGLAVLPAVGVIFLIRKLSWRLYLFQNGFVFAAGRNRIVLWTDIISLFERQDIVTGIRADKWLRVDLADGTQIRIDSAYKDFDVFNESLTFNVTREVLKRADGALTKGEAFSFGRITVSRDGLQKDEKKFIGSAHDALRWSDIQKVEIEHRQIGHSISNSIVIYKKSLTSKTGQTEWFVKPISAIPNAQAFLQMVDRLGNSTSVNRHPH